ncbi:MAG: hypothetical protein ACFE9R_01995 [Candidatus Hermodarchaeota archaeon]
MAHFGNKGMAKYNNNNILAISAKGGIDRGTLRVLAYFDLCHSATLVRLAHFVNLSIKWQAKIEKI